MTHEWRLTVVPSLRRRFQQNQEDCTFTVIALLPTVAENILDALQVENITHELQQQKAERLGRSAATSELTPSEFSSGSPSVSGEDGKSLSSFQTESFMHTSQMETSSSNVAQPAKQKMTKAQLWTELKISCRCTRPVFRQVPWTERLQLSRGHLP